MLEVFGLEEDFVAKGRVSLHAGVDQDLPFLISPSRLWGCLGLLKAVFRVSQPFLEVLYDFWQGLQPLFQLLVMAFHLNGSACAEGERDLLENALLSPIFSRSNHRHVFSEYVQVNLLLFPRPIAIICTFYLSSCLLLLLSLRFSRKNAGNSPIIFIF